ncbi:tetratricopeptide repeat protein, partial [Thermodesulfobacteriota bacterium]
PSIAVLPFTNTGSDPKNEYLADGITEGIITALSQAPGMFVIARNSTFTYKGKPVKVQRVSEELGVRYVLEGSVQVSGEKLRVNAQLIDTIKGHHLWAQRYDRDIKDIFALQDEITMKVITELQIKLTENQQAKISATGTNNLEAYLKYLQGWHHFLRMTPDDLSKARQLFEEAIQLDPKYVIPYARLCSVYIQGIRVGLIISPKKAIAMASEVAQKAFSIDASHPYTYVALSNVSRIKGQWDKAISLSEKSVALSPNDSSLLTNHGINLMVGGKPEEAISFYKKAMRLDPNNPMRYTVLAIAYRQLKKYDEAVPLLEKSLSIAPKNLLTLMDLAACYVGVGRMEDAKATIDKVLAIYPKMNAEIFFKRTKAKDQEMIKTFADLARKAGLPDKPPMKLPDKPSIAVLPFTNMSGDPKQEYFSDGITEDIITKLSKVSGLFVISRNSSFLYKGKNAKIKDVARDLGVRYVLEGSIRRGGNKVRITAQLIDGKTDQHVWADSYDRELKDVFSVQDDVTQKVASELAVALTGTETERMFRKHTENFEAYDLFLRARKLGMAVGSKEKQHKAVELLERVIELDPNFAGGYSSIAFILSRNIRFGYSDSPRKDLAKAFHLAKKAVSVDDTFMQGYVALASVYLMKKQHDKALAAARTALTIAPSDANAYAMLGFQLSWAGRGEEAVEAIKKAQQINPKYQHGRNPSFIDFMWLASFTARSYKESISASKESIERFGPYVNRLAFLAASYSEIGKEKEARATAQRLLKINPKFTLKSWRYARVYKNPEDTERLLNALHKAGLK